MSLSFLIFCFKRRSVDDQARILNAPTFSLKGNNHGETNLCAEEASLSISLFTITAGTGRKQIQA
jgi:hypothetical protein